MVINNKISIVISVGDIYYAIPTRCSNPVYQPNIIK